ncbi:MAG: nitroreductase family protein [Candidatus Helarchaeales archaeon]
MKIIGIDASKCKKCLACIPECPARLYHETKSESSEVEVYFSDPFEACIGCGHCIAVCPFDAIKFEATDEPFSFEHVKNPSELISHEDILKVLRARRSIRQYKQDDLPRDKIEAVLEAMRYAPSASNEQSWSYIVITDPVKKQLLIDKTMDMLVLLKKLLKIAPLIRVFLPANLRKMVDRPSTRPSLERIISEYNNGRDPVFHGAPCVIILHSPKYGHLAGNDAGLAFMHGMLAAQSLGLGTCWIGFAQEMLYRNKKVRKWLGVPKGEHVWGVMTLGVPAVKYSRVPPREPLRIKWL